MGKLGRKGHTLWVCQTEGNSIFNSLHGRMGNTAGSGQAEISTWTQRVAEDT